MHSRLRRALEVTRELLELNEGESPFSRDLLLFCHGFCTALTAHHQGEDRILFPAIAEQYPQLADTLRYLQQDHSMIAYLLAGLTKAVDEQRERSVLLSHLDGIAAIMESHFRYEERELLTVLEVLELHTDIADVLGPL